MEAELSTSYSTNDVTSQEHLSALPAYKVVGIDVSCCASAVPLPKIEQTCNDAMSSGYTLDQIYIDERENCGPCCGRTKCAVLVFRRADLPG